MVFPSPPLKAWCKNIQKLVDAPRPHKTAYADGFCQCELASAILRAPPKGQAQLASALFWSFWVDLVMCHVAGPRFYGEFRKMYSLPRLHFHPGLGTACPAWVLREDQPYPVPSPELLFVDKQEFWGEIADWLDSVARSDVKKKAIAAFEEDVERDCFKDLPRLF